MSTAQINGHYAEFTIHAGNLGLIGLLILSNVEMPQDDKILQVLQRPSKTATAQLHRLPTSI